MKRVSRAPRMNDPWVRCRHLYRTRAAVFSRTYRMLSVNIWMMTLAASAILATVIPAIQLAEELPVGSNERDAVQQLILTAFVNIVLMLVGYEIPMRFKIKLNIVKERG